MKATKPSRPIVEISHYSMKFGDKKVINDLSFTVNRGEVFGFLGSNGSGKTTTLRTLLGIYQPTEGELLIDGQAYNPKNHNGQLGYLPEERGLYKNEKVIDVMMYFGQLKGMKKADAKEWSLKYLKRVKLEDYANTRIDKLSGGMQQKVQLGVTIMNNPKLLILDEPTKGFDPVNRRLLMNIIEEYRQKGATIIFVTHQMNEVEELCDRIILLKNGQAAAYGTIKEVKAQHNGASLDDIFVSIYGDPELEEETE